jgi:hypothetical protein
MNREDFSSWCLNDDFARLLFDFANQNYHDFIDFAVTRGYDVNETEDLMEDTDSFRESSYMG